jgi:hypothetical protein
MEEAGNQKTYPETLLAFLYAVTYDQSVNMKFHSDSAAVMDQFKLSRTMQVAINDMGDCKDGDEAQRTAAVQKVLNLLCQEILTDEYKKIW